MTEDQLQRAASLWEGQSVGAACQPSAQPEHVQAAPVGLFAPLKVSFEIPGEPVGKGSVRVVQTPCGPRGFIPSKSRRWMDQVRAFAYEAMRGGPPMQGPVRLTCRFVRLRPGRLIKKRGPMDECPAPTRPDSSNIIKGLEDAMNGVVYRDDAQICEHHIYKLFAAGPGYGDCRPRVEVCVEEIQG